MHARTHTYTRTHTVCMLKQIYQQFVSWSRRNQLLFTCSNLGGNLLICVLCEWLLYNACHDFRGEGFSLHADHRQRQRVCSPACTQLGRSQPDTATSASRAGQSGRCMLSVEFWGLSPKLFWKKSNNNKSCNLVPSRRMSVCSGKPICTIPHLICFPSVAFETDPMFCAGLKDDGPFKEDC